MFKLCLLIVAVLELGPQDVKGLVGGIDAKEHEFPYHVLMKGKGKFICSGTLIHIRFFITNGLCREKAVKFKDSVTITVGTNAIDEVGRNYRIPRRELQMYLIRSTFKEIKFTLALYKLVEDVVLSDHVKLVNLPTADEIGVDCLDAKVCSVGHTETGGSISPRLQMLPVEILARHACQMRMSCSFTIPDYIVCGLPPRGKGVSPEDAGAPLVYNNILVGVAAGNAVSADGLPDFYINVFNDVELIRQIMQ